MWVTPGADPAWARSHLPHDCDSTHMETTCVGTCRSRRLATSVACEEYGDRLAEEQRVERMGHRRIGSRPIGQSPVVGPDGVREQGRAGVQLFSLLCDLAEYAVGYCI